MIERRYPAKILVFGEYTVLHGGTALAIPYNGFWGQFSYEPNFIAPDWKPFLSFLRRVNMRLMVPLDLSSLEQEINSGLKFRSNIPVGYGVGSSGAFCAFIYENFTEQPLPSSMKTLMHDLGEIENYFHGYSSGFDPLVSLLDKPLRNGPDGPRYVDLPHFSTLHLYLTGSSMSRATGPLVKIYSKMLRSRRFASIMKDLRVLTDQIIDIFLDGSRDLLWPNLRNLSKLQREHLHFLIPPDQMKLWQRMEMNENFTVKLCGAGGGGFLLVFGLEDISDDDFIKIF